MRQVIFRFLFVVTTLCFVGEDLCQTFGWQGRDLAELTEKSGDKKEKSEEKFDPKVKFWEAVDHLVELSNVETEGHPPLVCHAPFAILPAHLSIFSPPPEVATA